MFSSSSSIVLTRSSWIVSVYIRLLAVIVVETAEADRLSSSLFLQHMSRIRVLHFFFSSSFFFSFPLLKHELCAVENSLVLVEFRMHTAL